MIGSVTQWLPPPDVGGPVTCDVCGCRLTEASGAEEGWVHYPSAYEGQDARGCRPVCVAARHDRYGRMMDDPVAA
jgi:hypothetical protein